MALRSILARLSVVTVTACTWLALSAVAEANVYAGDTLNVIVFNHPDLSEKITVDASGHITYPLAGSLAVDGLDSPQIAHRLQAALTRYVRNVAVDVQVVGEGSFINIAGGPGGKVAFTPGETLMTALPSVKLVDDVPLERSRVDLSAVAVERDGNKIGTFDTAALSSTGGTGPRLMPNDTIAFVDKPVAVEVRGAVLHPGTAHLSATEPLSDAIAQLGGPLKTGATASNVLIRNGTQATMSAGDPTFDESAQAGDVVIVPVAPRVTVAGMVTSPGEKVLSTNFSLAGALYDAGGPTPHANLHYVQLIRGNDPPKTFDVTKLVHGDLAQNPNLKDGDLVFVPEGHGLDYSAIGNFLATLRFLVFP